MQTLLQNKSASCKLNDSKFIWCGPVPGPWSNSWGPSVYIITRVVRSSLEWPIWKTQSWLFLIPHHIVLFVELLLPPILSRWQPAKPAVARVEVVSGDSLCFGAAMKACYVIRGGGQSCSRSCRFLPAQPNPPTPPHTHNQCWFIRLTYYTKTANLGVENKHKYKHHNVTQQWEYRLSHNKNKVWKPLD